MDETTHIFVAIRGIAIALSLVAERFEYDDPEKRRKRTVQAITFLKDAEKTLEELLAKLDEKAVERREEI